MEWTARPSGPRRSLFDNYQPDTPAAEPGREPNSARHSHPAQPAPGAIDRALAHSFICGFLARAFADPTLEGWEWLCRPDTQQALGAAVRTLNGDPPAGLSPAPSQALGSAWQDIAGTLSPGLNPASFDSHAISYVAVFGHAARGRCPLNEIEYGDIKADPLFQPHRLADLAGFYRAFGLEVADEADERHDHLCLELEFMSVLSAKEAYALQHQLGPEAVAACQDARKKFLRDHLGRWTPAFARRLLALAETGPLASLAQFLRAYMELECARHNLAPGSEDLLLRPVDDTQESFCASCGLSQLPPGALPASTP